MKYGMTYWATDRTAMLVNRVGQEITQRSGSFTVMGKLSYAKEIKSIFTKEIARYTFKGALSFAGHGIGIAADLAQTFLEWLGYKKTGKAVGLCGNIAGGALVGGMTGGPIGAVVGGVGGALIWGVGQFFGWLFS